MGRLSGGALPGKAAIHTWHSAVACPLDLCVLRSLGQFSSFRCQPDHNGTFTGKHGVEVTTKLSEKLRPALCLLLEPDRKRELGDELVIASLLAKVLDPFLWIAIIEFEKQEDLNHSFNLRKIALTEHPEHIRLVRNSQGLQSGGVAWQLPGGSELEENALARRAVDRIQKVCIKQILPNIPVVDTRGILCYSHQNDRSGRRQPVPNVSDSNLNSSLGGQLAGVRTLYLDSQLGTCDTSGIIDYFDLAVEPVVLRHWPKHPALRESLLEFYNGSIASDVLASTMWHVIHDGILHAFAANDFAPHCPLLPLNPFPLLPC